MWKIFKHKQKKQLRELSQLSRAFAIIAEFHRRGLVHWQMKDRMLLIEESLALVELARGERGFKHFLDHLAAWQNFRLMRDAYEQRRIDIETAAVREAQKKYPKIDKDDIRRIRQQARQGMTEIDPDKLPVIREFDILVIRASALSRADATEENGQLLALGHYDGKTVEMAMYDDVKQNLKTEE